MMQANTLQDMSAAIAAWRSPSLMRLKPAQAIGFVEETKSVIKMVAAPQAQVNPTEERNSNRCSATF